ncbi:DUF4013 domain-containing protein [Methanoculleus sp. Wushi-C6]|uniref:DUF4013 domain-containing protein n=1 Tax=Methanoculleus caldifontis TaxID=2651577 RepID=A0ABU3X1P2_9EURY|nr:DUF4013 domain-containing protein [Methanoculleus sp. Wushi-C6]MDV2481978.1 DUF4013 domain-containing protein [Methanoculleus sp. Wushi-C6]
MDFGEMLSDSFGYAKDAVWGKWGRWALLVVSTIIFPLIMGYMVRIYSGARSAPEADNWVGMFVDGLKLLVIGIIYAIPVFIIMAIFMVPAIIAGGNGDSMLALGSLGIGLLLMIVVAIIISLVSAIGMIRFAQKDSVGQAFAFGAILEHIGKIGWGSYIIALIVLWIVGIVFSVITTILSAIPILGWLITLFLYPVWMIFAARYMTLIYQSAPAPA